MKNYKNDFMSFDGKIWLNAASEGPLPKVAAAALEEAITWKSKPYLLDNLKFASVPKELKESIARLIGIEARDVILANSASYGLHILANGIDWVPRDEILLMQNDFPTNILPWLALEKRGVKVIQLKPRDKVLTPDELEKNITPKTKLFCISHVHTFSGHALEVEAMAQICRCHHVLFVLNISQSAGTRPVDISKFLVDCVVSAGYKWLCGPYGTGFCWMAPPLRDQLHFNQANWILLSSDELKSEEALVYKEMKSARKYDVFGTANFFNFVPFKAAIDYWLTIGLDQVAAYHDQLINCFISQLDAKKYDFISPKEGKSRSSLVVISHKDKSQNLNIFRGLNEQEIYTAFWKGYIRIAPHVYNSQEDIAKLIKLLNQRP